MPIKHSWAVLSFRTVLGTRRNVTETTHEIAPISQKHFVVEPYVRLVGFESSSPDRLAPCGEMCKYMVLGQARAGLELGARRRVPKSSTALPDRCYDFIFRWHDRMSTG